MENKIVYKYPYYLSSSDLLNCCILVNKLIPTYYSFHGLGISYYWIKGDNISKDDICQLARSLGKLHICMSTIHSSYKPLQYYTHFPNIDRQTIMLMSLTLRRVIGHNITIDLIREYLFKCFETIRLSELPKQIIHGDSNPGNVVKTNKGLCWIDIVDIHYDYRIVDILWCIIYSFFWDNDFETIRKDVSVGEMKEFLKQYNCVNPLHESEVKYYYCILFILLVNSVFSEHSLWRQVKKRESLESNIMSVLEYYHIFNQIENLFDYDDIKN